MKRLSKENDDEYDYEYENKIKNEFEDEYSLHLAMKLSLGNYPINFMKENDEFRKEEENKIELE